MTFCTLAAARYIAGRIVHGRIDAIKRSTAVALRFEPSTPDYVFTPYADGNGNGVRAADIHRGVDPPVGVPHQLGDNFAGVRFGLLPDCRTWTASPAAASTACASARRAS